MIFNPLRIFTISVVCVNELIFRVTWTKNVSILPKTLCSGASRGAFSKSLAIANYVCKLLRY